MLWSWTSRLLGAACALVGGVLLTTSVSVSTPRDQQAVCGSAWDSLTGRVGWERWWAQDRVAPLAGSPLARTLQCPAAVNGRIAVGATLAFVAFGILIVGGALAARRTHHVGASARRLRTFGIGVQVLGGLLTVAGVCGLALLTADPNATLFLYVSRLTVVLLGLMLLLPAVLLIVLGSSLRLLASRLDTPGTPREAP